MSEQTSLKSKGPSVAALATTFILIIFALIFFFLFNSCSGDKPPTKSGYLYTDDDYFFYATGAAVDIVKNNLKYPKNAEFQDPGDMSVYYDKNSGDYLINGYVYASNAFGVKSKHFFTVKCTLIVSKSTFAYTEKYCDIQ